MYALSSHCPDMSDEPSKSTSSRAPALPSSTAAASPLRRLLPSSRLAPTTKTRKSRSEARRPVLPALRSRNLCLLPRRRRASSTLANRTRQSFPQLPHQRRPQQRLRNRSRRQQLKDRPHRPTRPSAATRGRHGPCAATTRARRWALSLRAPSARTARSSLRRSRLVGGHLSSVTGSSDRTARLVSLSL